MRLKLLIAAAIIIAAIASMTVYTQRITTGTVVITVSGYIAASPIDSNSRIDVDPASAQTVSLNNLPSWVAINANDDMIFNLTGTNVNLTIGYTYSIVTPPSYPSGLKKPYVAVYLSVTHDSASTTLSADAVIAVMNYTITLDPANSYLGGLYTGTKLSWINLPEGFLNTFYGKGLDETSWYTYVYASEVSLPSLSLFYDSSTGKLEADSGTKLCLVLVDPDGSINSGYSPSGDEMIIVAPTCNLDADTDDTTPGSPAPSRSDLIASADYIVPGGVAALTNTPAAAFYAYNQTDFAVLNFTVSYPSGVTANLYFQVQLKVDSNAKKIYVTLKPVFPMPYSYTLAQLYASNFKPYLHAWPVIALPVGAPAGVYKATVYLKLEQT